MYKPKKPYKNLEDYRRRHCWTKAQRDDKSFWPCSICNGRGKVDNDIDNTIKCPCCFGKKSIDKKYVYDAYRTSLEDWRSELEYCKKEEVIRKQAIAKLAPSLAKLTEKERQVLGLND